MKKRIYIKTSVVSYFTVRPSRDIMIAGHQEATRDIWPEFVAKYETHMSALVYDEVGKGDPIQAEMRLTSIEPFPMLDIDDEAISLAEKHGWAEPLVWPIALEGKSDLDRFKGLTGDCGHGTSGTGSDYF